jgi:hypothetical protein
VIIDSAILLKPEELSERTVALAWAAGVFEGEGCFSLHKVTSAWHKEYRYFRMSMGMTDEDVVRRFHKS